MAVLTRKGYARIYVRRKEDIEKVKYVIKEIDKFEYEYLPENLIAPFSEYPKVVCTHKFDGLDMEMLISTCWSRGVCVYVLDSGLNEFPTNLLSEQDNKRKIQ